MKKRVLIKYFFYALFIIWFYNKMKKRYHDFYFARKIRKYKRIRDSHSDRSEKACSQFMIGKFLQKGLKDYKAAIEEFYYLIENFSDSLLLDNTYYNIGICYEKTNNKVEASKVYNELLTKFPSSYRRQDVERRLERLNENN